MIILHSWVNKREMVSATTDGYGECEDFGISRTAIRLSLMCIYAGNSGTHQLKCISINILKISATTTHDGCNSKKSLHCYIGVIYMCVLRSFRIIIIVVVSLFIKNDIFKSCQIPLHQSPFLLHLQHQLLVNLHCLLMLPYLQQRYPFHSLPRLPWNFQWGSLPFLQRT